MQLGLSNYAVISFGNLDSILHFLLTSELESEPELLREEVAHVNAARLVRAHRDHLELLPLRLLF